MTCPRCADLQAKLEEAEEALRQLHDADADDYVALLVDAFRLTPQEALLVNALFVRPRVVTRDALWGAVAGWNPDIERKTVDVIVSKARKKIAPLRIETVWGVGYRLDDCSRSTMSKAIGI